MSEQTDGNLKNQCSTTQVYLYCSNCQKSKMQPAPLGTPGQKRKRNSEYQRQVPQMTLSQAWVAVQIQKRAKVEAEWKKLEQKILSLPRDKKAMCMADWQALNQQNSKHCPRFMNTVPQWVQARHLMRQQFAKVASRLPQRSELDVGPWQGGIPAQEQDEPNHIAMEGITLVAWNVKGAFSEKGGMHNRDARIIRVVQSLIEVGAVMAIISDSQLGLNDSWRGWTKYHIYIWGKIGQTKYSKRPHP